MLNYTDLSGEMPLQAITQALDDDGDGQADDLAWQKVLSSARMRIDEAFGGAVPPRYAGAAQYALRIFCCEILYRRRGFSGERNPYTSQANRAEDRLRKLATGEETPEGGGGGTMYGEPAKIAGTKGLMA